MKFLVFTVCFILNLIVAINSWGYYIAITQDELIENKNLTKKHFQKGFKLHTMKIGLRFKNSQNNEVNIFSLTSNSNKLNLKYFKKENEIIFQLYVVKNNQTNLMEVQYPNINLEDDNFHFLVYRLGSSFFKLWVDCELKKNIDNELKIPVNIDQAGFSTFGNNIILQHGDNNDVEYNQQIDFINHPVHPILGYSFSDKSTCKNVFNSTRSLRINDNYTEGIFYPLKLFQDVLVKYDSPGVYYEINKSTTRDVSEYFEDGLDKDHSFEITYRIKSFPVSNYSYYFILLKSGAESSISLALDGKRNILKVDSSCNCNGNLVHYSTEYWADQIYNNDWHTIKYTLNNGIFTLWIDNEIMEDFLGVKHVDLKFKGYDINYVWFDTVLMILEPKSGLHREPVLHIRQMKYYGNAITTNNTELSLSSSKEEEQDGYLNSFFKVIGRLWISK